MKFAMPYNTSLEIRPSLPLTYDEEEEIGIDEEREDLVWNVYWGDKMLPWSSKTRNQAYTIALGCQWGAHEMKLL